MKFHIASYRRFHIAFLTVFASALLGGMSALAGVPQARQGLEDTGTSVGVLPPQAKPRGYSLVDDSPPILGTFPDINDRNAVVAYFYSAQQLGLQYANITIDGQVFSLDERYIAAVRVPALPDGGGTGYMPVAAYVKPLKKGTHTVEISASVTGVAVPPWCEAVGFSCPDGFSFSITYTVVVR